ncbi:hypothetical protein ACET3Z_031332 [Daucus carota]
MIYIHKLSPHFSATNQKSKCTSSLVLYTFLSLTSTLSKHISQPPLNFLGSQQSSILFFHLGHLVLLSLNLGCLQDCEFKRSSLKIGTSLMEWYFSNDGDDLVVPKDMKPIDRLPSPNSWSDWGVSDFHKKNIDAENLCDELDLSISRHQMECSSNSSMSYGFQNNLQQWGTSTQRQSDDIQMDEIYMNSLLDEDLATENLYGSSSFSPQSNSNFGGSNYYDNDTFSPKTDWNREASNSFPSIKEPVLKDSVASEHGTGRVYMHEQTSLEESVLQELEMVTSKLNLKTRNCFRDSLYRLAENSRTNTSTPVQNGDLVIEKKTVETVNNEKSSVQETEATESKTNAIDRAVANLMFAKMDFFVEEESQAPVKESQNVKCEADGRTEQFQYNSGEPWATCFPMLVGDAEVPVVGK